MASLFDSLTVARSALLTHQARLAVTGNNIANVDTDGYHRQKMIIGSSPAIEPTLLDTRDYSIGSGVTVLDVVRTYDHMKEVILLGEQSDAAAHADKGDALADMERLIVGTGDASIPGQLTQFWHSWQDLANNADSLTFRSVVTERGATLADQIKLVDDRLANYRSLTASSDGGAPPAYSGQVADNVAEVNAIASELEDLNYRIAYTSSSFQPHELENRRTVLLRELSNMIDINIGTDFTVSIDGQTLVSGDGQTRNTLNITSASTPVALELNGSAVTTTGGSIGAGIDIAAMTDTLRGQLDTLASSLISTINSIHNSDSSTTGDAYDLDGNRSAIDFFSGTGASDIEVNVLIHDSANPLNDNPRLLAVAATRHDPGPPPTANPGDGAKALEIADAADTKITALGNQSFGDFFVGVLGALGSAARAENAQAADGNAVVGMLMNAIDSESGVNLDEEMIEMMSAQRAYEAAARLMKTIDGMISTIINELKS